MCAGLNLWCVKVHVPLQCVFEFQQSPHPSSCLSLSLPFNKNEMQEQWWGTMLSPSITTFHKRPLTFMLCTATQCPPLHRAVALFSTLSKFIFIFHVSPYWLIYLLYSHRSCKPRCCHLTHGLPWYVFFFFFSSPIRFLADFNCPQCSMASPPPWHLTITVQWEPQLNSQQPQQGGTMGWHHDSPHTSNKHGTTDKHNDSDDGDNDNDGNGWGCSSGSMW